jgi:hypothetical protein
MARSTFTKRDLNRYQKVYPFIRRTPREEVYASAGMIVEIAEISFSANALASYTFRNEYAGTPIVTATVKEPGGAAPTLSISALSATAVEIIASADWTGTAELHIIYIPS